MVRIERSLRLRDPRATPAIASSPATAAAIPISVPIVPSRALSALPFRIGQIRPGLSAILRAHA